MRRTGDRKGLHAERDRRAGRIAVVSVALVVGHNPPGCADMEFVSRRVVANAALAPAGLNGSVSVNVPNPTHLIPDINGCFQ